MGLQFTDASTNKLSYGSGSSLANLSQKTIMLRFKPSAMPDAYRGLFGKLRDGDYLQGFSCGPDTGLGAGVLNAAINDTGYSRITVVSSAVWTTGEVQTFALTLDHSTSGNNDMFRGTFTSNMVSVKASGVYNALSGYDDSANPFQIGTVVPTSDTACLGMDLYEVAVFSRILTLGEMISWQWRPRVMSGCVLFNVCHTTGTQPDWSGNANSGTITGASATNHTASSPLFGAVSGWQGSFITPAATGTNFRMQRFFRGGSYA